MTEPLQEGQKGENLPEEYTIQKNDRLLSIVNRLVPGLNFQERMYACFILKTENPKVIRNIHLIHGGKTIHIPKDLVARIKSKDADFRKVAREFAAEGERFKNRVSSKTQIDLLQLKTKADKAPKPKAKPPKATLPKIIAEKPTPQKTPPPEPPVKTAPKERPRKLPKALPEQPHDLPTLAPPGIIPVPAPPPPQTLQDEELAPQQTTEPSIMEKAQIAIMRSGPIEAYVKPLAYAKYGSRMYKPRMEYPVPDEKPSSNPAQTPEAINLKPNVKLNEGSDSSGWVSIAMGDGSIYHRAEYHAKDLDFGAESVFDQHITQRGDNYTPEYLETMRQNGKIQIISFPLKDFELGYFPGATLLKQNEDGSRKGFLREGDIVNPAIGKILARHTKLSQEQQGRAIAIFNGTYHQDDNVTRIGGRAAFGGVIVDGREVIRPAPEMGSIAIYDDGTVRMGSYKNLPEKERIRELRQNLGMILENRNFGAQANSRRLFRFQDNIVSSYVAMDLKGNLAYIYGNHLPPRVMARVLQRLGYRDAMLLDIHPVIAARVVSPGKNSVTEGGYDFVPHLRKGFQWHYQAGLRGSPHDFFAILRKGPSAPMAEGHASSG